MPVKWSIREARYPEDTDTVRQLMRDYERDMGEKLCLDGFEEELANLPGKYRRPGGLVVLGYLHQKPVGCGAIRPLSDHACEMKRLYVAPEARGQGIGRAIVRRLLREARLQGYRTMKLDTLKRMEAAIQLYDTMGFTPCEPYHERAIEDVVFYERAI